MIGRTSFDTPCRVEIEHSEEFLCAHVDLPDAIEIRPGDQVRVHGGGFAVPFGERRVFERTATIERAGAIERLWTKVAGHFEMAELYEVSFSPGAIR